MGETHGRVGMIQPYFSARELNVVEKGINKTFGYPYYGYYCVHERIRHVGYVGVRERVRYRGHYHSLLERFKKGVNGVILYNPNTITVKAACQHGYVLDIVRNVMVWKR